MGFNAFSNCKSLGPKIILPKSMTRIPESLFSECLNLKEIHLSIQTKVIKKNAVSDCAKLEIIKFGDMADNVLPETLPKIGDGAFYKTNLPEPIKSKIEVKYPQAFSHVV